MADASIQITGDPFTISSSCVHDPNPTIACTNLDPWSAGPFPASVTISLTSLWGDPIIGTILGTGNIDLSDGYVVGDPFVIYFNSVDFGFQGNASLAITPEPGSMVLAGTGMLALLEALRRKGRAKHCQ
jgi:hypothetical protein